MSSDQDTIKNDNFIPLDRKEISTSLKPFMEVKPWVYWIDFLLSVIIGFSSFQLLNLSASTDLMSILLYMVSVFSFLRALGFIHEISHQSKGKNSSFMKKFRFAWNLLIGVPFMLSSPFYSCHLKHHSSKTFGTEKDPQYPHFRGNPLKVIGFVIGQAVASVLLLPVRLLLLNPLSLFSSKLRMLIENRFSSIAEPHYIADFSAEDTYLLRRNDALSFIFWVAVITSVVLGLVPVNYIYTYLFVVFGVMLVNNFRVLGEHKHEQRKAIENENLFDKEFLDSFNYTKGGLLIELLYNTGLRYHALHHLMPQIPYHNLSKAHRYLKNNLPANSIYNQVEAKGHLYNVIQLFSK
ncbi:MAG: fatty acid desaturase family protein [Pseudomonadales bacterium]